MIFVKESQQQQIDHTNKFSIELPSTPSPIYSPLQFEKPINMQQQQFSEMEMPTQSSPSHHQSSSQNYHHAHQQHQSTSSSGSSTTKRISSQSISNSINPNGLSGPASSSHCVSSSSSSPPHSSAGRHGYSTLPTPGSPSPAGASCLAEPGFNSQSCYNNNNPGDIIAAGASPHSVIHCSHLSTGQQHPIQSYLQGKKLWCKKDDIINILLHVEWKFVNSTKLIIILIAEEIESVENTVEGASTGSYYPTNAGNGGGPYRYHRTNVRERKRMMR